MSTFNASLFDRPLSLDQIAAIGRSRDLLRRLIAALAGSVATTAPLFPDPNEFRKPRDVREDGTQSVSDSRSSVMKSALALVLGLATLATTTSFAPAAPTHGETRATVLAKDPVGGKQVFEGDVGAFSSASTKIYLRAGEVTQIAMLGDGDTDIDLYVYDEFGSLVAMDEGNTDRGIVFVTPRWTGEFTIVVRNRGGVYNHVLLAAE